MRNVTIRLHSGTMITYRLLTPADLTSLYECFLEAFSDYQVDMRMSQEQFERRIARDGVRLQISAGAFHGNRMIGFYMNASGTWLGKLTAYDAGTGVIPAYRRQGVAKELFAFMVAHVKEASCTQYLLEVLTTNEPAVSLYRRLGTLVGPLCEKSFDEVHADLAIVGGAGITEKGIWSHNALIAAAQRKMIAAAERTFFALDKSKFGRTALSLATPFDARFTIVTDTRPAPAVARAIHTAGARLTLGSH